MSEFNLTKKHNGWVMEINLNDWNDEEFPSDNPGLYCLFISPQAAKLPESERYGEAEYLSFKEVEESAPEIFSFPRSAKTDWSFFHCLARSILQRLSTGHDCTLVNPESGQTFWEVNYE